MLTDKIDSEYYPTSMFEHNEKVKALTNFEENFRDKGK